MKKTIISGVAALAILLAPSCSDDLSNGGSGMGYITPVVGLDDEMTDLPGKAVSRADGSGGNSDSATGSEAGTVSVEDLSLKITATDGSFMQTWAKLSDFDSSKKFKVGDYVVEAFYGDSIEEGFEIPAFYGKKTVTVADGQTTSLAFTATPANATVKLNFSDAFSQYMEDYSATVTTSRKDILVSKDEERPLYIASGSIRMTLDVTKPNGQTATLEALKNMPVKSGYSYNINIDMKDSGGSSTGAGNAGINISYQIEVDAVKEVDIDISDELMSAAEPVLTPVYTPGSQIALMECTERTDLQVNVIAMAGIKSVTLKSESDILPAGWPAEIDLVAATAEQQKTLTDNGLKVLGLWKNKAEMAVIDFSKAVAMLRPTATSANEVKYTVSVTDNIDRTVAVPAELSVKLTPLAFTFGQVPATYIPGENITFTFTYNADEKDIAFTYTNNAGNEQAIEALPVGKGDNLYEVSFAVPENRVGDIDIYARLKNNTRNNAKVEGAKFTLETKDTDCYATYGFVLVKPLTGYSLPDLSTATVTACAEGETEYKTVGAQPITYNGYTNYLKVSGLDPSKTYKFRVTVDGKTAIGSLVTEEAQQLPNAGFENWSSEKKGDYQYLWTAADWKTVNETTCGESVGSGSGIGTKTGGTAYKATSGTIPANSRTTKGQDDGGLIGTNSSGDGNTQGNANLHNDKQHSGSNAALVRTVSWGSGNSASGKMSGQHFGTAQNKTPGELKLEGYSFGSRPSSISFWYHYDVVKSGNGDYGTVEVQVLDAAGNAIASANSNITEQSAYTQMTFPFSYGIGTPKAAKISIRFVSSANADIYNSESTNNWRCPGVKNVSGGEYSGSELYIDDITLTY